MISNFKLQIANSKKGFTLIELLIVVVIIGVLAALFTANFLGVRQRARDGQRKSDLRQMQAALELYRADQGSYPVYATFASLANCTNRTPAYFGNAPTCNTTYVQKIPTDPLNSAQFVYSFSSDGSTYTLVACLENVNDAQKDAANNATYCTGGTTNWSYTLLNP